MSDPLRHFDNLICIAEFVAMSEERKEMLRLAASELARLRLTDAERRAIEWAVSAARNVEHPAEDTLRGLLERLV